MLFKQVVRCLLIAPNPESALNEEAGMMLLENYDEYFHRAKLMTKIHASTSTLGAETKEKNLKASEGTEEGKKGSTTDKKKKKSTKKTDKKRSLKRL
jgi:ubiquitin-conjugating enzyme E2 S